MSILLYKVEKKNIVRSTDTKLDDHSIYIIVDRSLIRPKIWVWSGTKSDVKDRYYAGVSATTIKSQEKLYGSSIEVVEGGSEPGQFPKLEEARFLPLVPEEMEGKMPAEEVKAPKVVESPLEGSTAEEKVKAEVVQEVPSEKQLEVAAEDIAQEQEIHKITLRKRAFAASPSDRLWKEKIKSFIMDLSHDLESIKNKVDAFLVDL